MCFISICCVIYNLDTVLPFPFSFESKLSNELYSQTSEVQITPEETNSFGDKIALSYFAFSVDLYV